MKINGRGPNPLIADALRNPQDEGVLGFHARQTSSPQKQVCHSQENQQVFRIPGSPSSNVRKLRGSHKEQTCDLYGLIEPFQPGPVAPGTQRQLARWNQFPRRTQPAVTFSEFQASTQSSKLSGGAVIWPKKKTRPKVKGDKTEDDIEGPHTLVGGNPTSAFRNASLGVSPTCRTPAGAGTRSLSLTVSPLNDTDFNQEDLLELKDCGSLVILGSQSATGRKSLVLVDKTRKRRTLVRRKSRPVPDVRKTCRKRSIPNSELLLAVTDARLEDKASLLNVPTPCTSTRTSPNKDLAQTGGVGSYESPDAQELPVVCATSNQSEVSAVNRCGNSDQDEFATPRSCDIDKSCFCSATGTEVRQSGDSTPANPQASEESEVDVESKPEGEFKYEVGDVICLGPNVDTVFRLSPAIIMKVAEDHCTAAVLDSERRLGIGECWPYYGQIAMLESSVLRLGSRIVVHGMKGQRTKRLNGFSGEVIRHPREGHPSFIAKPSRPDQPQLTVCVRFDDPVGAGERSALIEPRFLLAEPEYFQRVSDSLEKAIAAANLDVVYAPPSGSM